MTAWIAAQFPPSTLPVFVPIFAALVAGNVVIWRWIFGKNRRF